MIIMITILQKSLVFQYWMSWTRMGHLTRLRDCTGKWCITFVKSLSMRRKVFIFWTLFVIFCMWNLLSCSGLDRFEARKKLWADLEDTGLAVKKEPHTLRVPRSQRGGEVSWLFHFWCVDFQINLLNVCITFIVIFSVFLSFVFSFSPYQVIEPLVSKQWFVTMEPLAEKALHAVEKGDLKIIPERFEKVCKLYLNLKIGSYCLQPDLTDNNTRNIWEILQNYVIDLIFAPVENRKRGFLSFILELSNNKSLWTWSLVFYSYYLYNSVQALLCSTFLGLVLQHAQ